MFCVIPVLRLSSAIARVQAKRFLAQGVLPSATDKEGRSGAHLAASRGDLATMRLLHSVGASLVAADNIGRTPLHNAAMRDRTSAITYLVHKGAWVDVVDAAGCSPLHLAARAGAAGAASRLLDLGAAAHMCNKWQLTALGTLFHYVCCGPSRFKYTFSETTFSHRHARSRFRAVHTVTCRAPLTKLAYMFVASVSCLL